MWRLRLAHRDGTGIYGKIFRFELRGRGQGQAFVDMGDQFLALRRAAASRRTSIATSAWSWTTAAACERSRNQRGPLTGRSVPRLSRPVGQPGRGRRLPGHPVHQGVERAARHAPRPPREVRPGEEGADGQWPRLTRAHAAAAPLRRSCRRHRQGAPMPSKREQVLSALHARLDAGLAAAVRRNEVAARAGAGGRPGDPPRRRSRRARRHAQPAHRVLQPSRRA